MTLLSEMDGPQIVATLDAQREDQWGHFFDVLESLDIDNVPGHAIDLLLKVQALPEGLTLQEKVEELGYNWTDQPQDNGFGVYWHLIQLNENMYLLVRALLIFRYLRRQGMTIAEIEHRAFGGLQGGGQIAQRKNSFGEEFDLFDRFSLHPGRVRFGIQFIHQSTDGQAVKILREQYNTLSEKEKYWIGYRWFGNKDGWIPAFEYKHYIDDYDRGLLAEWGIHE